MPWNSHSNLSIGSASTAASENKDAGEKRLKCEKCDEIVLGFFHQCDQETEENKA